jgi:hypothetical protein
MSETPAIDPIADVLDALLEDRSKLLAENQQQAAILDDLCDWAQHVAAPEDDRIHSIVERAEAALAGTPSESQFPRPRMEEIGGGGSDVGARGRRMAGTPSEDT